MKALQNHIILFDAECPMCTIYTQAMVKTGMLESEGRAAYQEMPEEVCPFIDRQRAANEIALVNTVTGEVSYGVQSLFTVLGNAMPFFKPLFHWKFFGWTMSKVYAWIAYNRRVIVPAASGAATGQIQPTFRLKYRLLYLLFTWIITASILSVYSKLMGTLIEPGDWYREYLICGGQLGFQGAIVLFLHRSKLWDYLGHIMTISLAGALLLLPFILLNNFASISPVSNAIYFIAVAGLMFVEHIRRVKLLQLSGILSLTWVLYRLLLLLVLAG